MKVVQACLCGGNTIPRHFRRRKWAVKNVQPSLSARNDGESNFHHCGGLVKVVEACLCVGSSIQRRFHRRREAAKHVQACGSANKDGETVFTSEEVLCSWCKPVYVRETPYNAVLTAEEVL